MSKHAASLIRLPSAIHAYAAAQERCPHWDYEGFYSAELHECCLEIVDAESELQNAKAAVSKESQ